MTGSAASAPAVPCCPPPQTPRSRLQPQHQPGRGPARLAGGGGLNPEADLGTARLLRFLDLARSAHDETPLHLPPHPQHRRPPNGLHRTAVSRLARAARRRIRGTVGRLQLPALRNASTAEASLGSLLKVAVHRANVAVARDLAAREPSCLTATPHGGAVLRCLAAADQPAGDFAEAVCAALAHHWRWRGEGGTSPSGAVRLPATQPPSPPVAWLPMPPIGVSLQFKVCPSGSSANGSVWLTLAEAKCGGGEAAE